MLGVVVKSPRLQKKTDKSKLQVAELEYLRLYTVLMELGRHRALKEHKRPFYCWSLAYSAFRNTRKWHSTQVNETG